MAFTGRGLAKCHVRLVIVDLEVGDFGVQRKSGEDCLKGK